MVGSDVDGAGVGACVSSNVEGSEVIGAGMVGSDVVGSAVLGAAIGLGLGLAVTVSSSLDAEPSSPDAKSSMSPPPLIPPPHTQQASSARKPSVPVMKSSSSVSRSLQTIAFWFSKNAQSMTMVSSKLNSVRQWLRSTQVEASLRSLRGSVLPSSSSPPLPSASFRSSTSAKAGMRPKSVWNSVATRASSGSVQANDSTQYPPSQDTQSERGAGRFQGTV